MKAPDPPFTFLAEDLIGNSELGLLKEAIESANDVVLILRTTKDDPMTARIIYANAALERETGYTREEVIGKTPRIFVGPKTSKAVDEAVNAALKNCQPVRAELVNYRKDGTEIWVDLSAHPIPGEETDGARYWVSVRRNITERKRAEEALRDRQARLRMLVDQMPAILWTTDMELRITSSDGAGLAKFDLTPGQLVGTMLMDFLQTYDPTYLPLTAHFRALAGESSSYEMEFRGWMFQTHIEPLRDAEGEIIGTVGVTLDVTSQRQVEADLRRSEARLAAAQALARLGSWDADFVTGEIHWSDQLYEILGVEHGLEKPPGVEDFCHPDDADSVAEALEEAKRSHKPYSIEHRIVPRDGATRHVLEQGDFVFDETGRAVRLLGTVLDVTDRKLAQERISYLSQHDLLTDLPNLTLFKDRLGQVLAHSQRTGRNAAVLYVDIDRFKNINDTLGHSIGDKLLAAMAERLISTFRSGDTVARAAGDEFIVALADMGQAEDALLAARKLADALAAPFSVGEREFFVTASMGVSVYPQDSDDPETLIRNAETAMYQAKEYGVNAFRLFTPAMHAIAVKRLLLESDLRKALERDEFVVLYQPIVNLGSGKVVGAEALVRWKHPVLGLIPPADFIYLAEETGLIEPLGERVLQTACEQSRRWHVGGLSPMRVCVNLSPQQFANGGLAKMVDKIIREKNLEPASLELEITESLVTKDADAALRSLRELRQMGVRLTLDDFGTGYSSLSLLKNFPIDTLKIDRSFVQQMSVDPYDKAIADTIITLGHSLRLNVIAEGVETRAQLILLRHAGCDEVQGFYFSRAVPAESLFPLLQKHFA